MASDNRPLSPFLTYRFPLTVILSISHRISGVFLVIGTLLMVYVLISLAIGPEAYQLSQAIVGSFFGKVLLFLWTYALFFHFCNGIRHLVWDAGYGFNVETVDKTALAAIVISLLLTVIVWGVALLEGAGQ